jgi:GNAT superfamily N-acetyltransferase
MKIKTKVISPALWPALEKLFGPNGACGGCWCMWWRVERGGKLWEETRGVPAKRAFKQLVVSGQAKGVLAFVDGEPVGWCSLGPRAHFPRLERVRAYRRSGATGVWSINCFFIARHLRGKGVARTLLKAAVRACKQHGAEIIEAYPVTTTREGKRLADAFSWTGPLKIFEEQGFTVVQADPPTKPLAQLRLRRWAAGEHT